MELGSNSPVIVHVDADIDRAVPAITDGGFAQAGQNCLGVQRVFVHEDRYETFRDRFVEQVSNLVAGSSLDEKTDVCAMINKGQAFRVESWVNEAIEKGAKLLVGGQRNEALYAPTVLEQVPEGARLDTDEVYGPVVSLYRVSSLDEAIAQANRVDYGLHAAIFTEVSAPLTKDPRTRCRRGYRQRLDRLPPRCHALRGHEAQRHRPRGYPFRPPRNDGNESGLF